MNRIALIALTMLAWFTAAIAAPIAQSPLPAWVSVEPASDCTAGCWRATVSYENEDESGGNHNIYGRLTLADGSSPAGLAWHVAYPDGDVRILTKVAPEWADFPIFACFDFDVETGAYWAYAGDNQAQSDKVMGMGLPQCLHVNYRIVWVWSMGNAPPTPTPAYQLWLPTVSR